MIKSSNTKSDVIVVAHNIRSLYNIGALFRTCEGLGVKKLILSGYSAYPKTKSDKRLPHESLKIDKAISKTALGAEKLLDWQKVDNLSGLIDSYRGKGYKIVALEQSPRSINLFNYKPPAKILLILGNELSGVDNGLMSSADDVIEIPMSGQKNSFNVVVAAAIAISHLIN